MKGLIVKPEWAELILSGQKTLELRGSPTKIRGKIGIIKSKTGKVYGTAEIIDSVPLSEEAFYQTVDQHQVTCSYENIPYSKLPAGY